MILRIIFITVTILLFAMETVKAGKKSKDGDYSFQAFLTIKTTGEPHVCGAAIIDKWHVITAARCFNRAPVLEVKVQAGFTDLKQKGKNTVTVFMDHIYMYDDNDHTNDIALLRVNEEIPFSRSVGAVKFQNSSNRSDNCAVLGWGHRMVLEDIVTGYDGSIPEPANNGRMEVKSVKISEIEGCRSKYASLYRRNVNPGSICVGGDSDCVGDTGGPLVCKDLLVGVLSWGGNCYYKGADTVYSEIFYYHYWIKSTLRQSYKDINEECVSY